MTADLQRTIDDAWETRDTLNVSTKGAVRDAVEHVLNELDNGHLRVAEKVGGEWHVHHWLKKAVLLSFRLNMRVSAPCRARSCAAPPSSPRASC